MGKFVDITGQVFGVLRVIKLDHIKRGSGAHWLCLCDEVLGGCGNTKVIVGSSLKTGNTRSCGCKLTKTKESVLEYIKNIEHEILDVSKGKNNIWFATVLTRDGYVLYNTIYNLKIGNFSIVNKANPYSLKNISLWLKRNNKNFELCDDNNKYLGNKESLKFYCYKCNDFFISNWSSIRKGDGCLVCRGFQIGKTTSMAYLFPELVKEWSIKNKLSPNDVTKGSHKDILWKCSICGYEWYAKVYCRTDGNGCPICKQSRGEKEILRFLLSHKMVEGIDFKRQHKFTDCKNKERLPFDFFILFFKTCIEFQGMQHYKPVGIWGGKEKLERTVKNDKIKINYCFENNIKLISISYLEINKIENILEKELFSL